MEQIGQLIKSQTKKDSMMPPSELHASSQKMMLKHGSRDVFLNRYSPDSQLAIAKNSEDCHFGDYPTLAEMRIAYGNNAPIVWCMTHLLNLSEYCGCKDKLTGRPLEECASIVASEFYYLKISELMLFFYRFKTGKYGRFYGSIDPLIITTSLRSFFLKERNDAYDRYAKEAQRLREQESSKDAISWEEYREKYCTSDKAHPFERTTERPSLSKTEEPTENIMQTAKSIVGDTSMDENTRLQFDRIFKKKYGCTPREYINNHTKEA